MEEGKTINKAAAELSKLGASKGGIARAKKLTPEERSEIARLAVQTRWDKTTEDGDTPRLARATHQGELNLGTHKISCAVLEDGTRVLVERSMATALGKRGSGRHWEKKKEGDTKSAYLPEYVSAHYLSKFMTDELRHKLENPINYIPLRGSKSKTFKGVDAILLADICDLWITAKEKGALNERQAETANRAYTLMKAFANVGIVALIDEATGFQEIRDKQALQKILEMYIAKALRPWVRTFPPDFYEHLFRLRGWQYRPLDMGQKRPILVGKITNNLIYSRLAPKVLEELKRLTVRDDKGRTKHRYFQRLSEDIGHPKLKEHLVSVTTLMKASDTWDGFYRLLNKVLPQYGKNGRFDFYDELPE